MQEKVQKKGKNWKEKACLALAPPLSIAIPGFGFALKGKPRKFIALQLLLIATLITFCVSRWITYPKGITIFFVLVIAIHIINPLFVLYTRPQENFNSVKNLASTLAIASLFIFMCSYLFSHKQDWLGIHLNYIPSTSMKPSLLPGDIILVDTWAYKYQEPKNNDVVVFSLPRTDYLLVKRIAPWPTPNSPPGEYYVIGDNKIYSKDSRNFGGIRRQWIIGRAVIKFTTPNNYLPVKL